MTTQLTIIAQSAVLPLLFSLLLYAIRGHSKWLGGTSLLLAWLLLVSWIRGLPPLVPVEALDWVWIVGLLVLLLTGLQPRLKQAVAYTLVLTLAMALALIVYAWPVLRHQALSPATAALVVTVILAATYYHYYGKIIAQSVNQSVARVLLISTGSLGMASLLAGSLLIGQLGLALSALLGSFAYVELRKKVYRAGLSHSQCMIVLTLFLSLLFIARVYAELPGISAVLLLLAPWAGIQQRWRHASLLALLAGTVAIVWVLVTVEQTGY